MSAFDELLSVSHFPLGAILGASVGIAGGLAGVLVGVCAPRGKGRPWVLGTMVSLSVVCPALLLGGLVALGLGQPYAIWYGLLLPGAIGSLLFPMAYFQARTAYQQFERRRLEAANFREA